MAKVKEIYEILNEKFPFSTQEDWDNSGLLVDSGVETPAVIVCLDVTHRVIDIAVERDAKLIVSHHPVIFGGIKSVKSDDIVYRLIRNDISVISAHTNFDKYRYGTCYSIAEKLKLEPVFDDGFEIGLKAVTSAVSCRQLAENCRNIFGSASFTLADKKVENIFICAGSGSGMMAEVLASGADCFITGESKYHDMLDFAEKNIAVITVGHDASEKISLETLEAVIKENFRELETEIYAADNLQQHIGEI